ncbi:MAG: single-stranded DNA-binding protein [Microbacterium sp.]
MNDSISITGNIATPPEQKRTPAGVAITTFRLASGQRRYDRAAGAWIDTGTNWYTVSTYRSLADHAFQSLSKGDRVVLTGRLRVRDWENGTKRGTDVEIDAEAIGHDLLWGTTTFTKTARSASDRGDASGTQQSADDPADGETGDDEWAAPGVADSAAADWPVAGADAAAFELASAETPY